MASDREIPADIFEEMAGIKEVELPVSNSSAENVEKETIITPIDEVHLKLASISFVSKVQKKLVKGFYKVAKELLSLQKKEAKKLSGGASNIHITIVRHEAEEDAEARENAKSWNPFKAVLKAVWWAIKQAIKFVVKQAIKAIIKAVVNIGKTLFKTFKKIIRVGMQMARKTLRMALRMMTKLSKFIFKKVKLIVKAIWKIIKNLFFRGKAGEPFFKKEPKPSSMAQPSIPKKKNKMKLKMKAPIKKLIFIFKALKKAFKMISKLFWKIISKIFGKIIKKAIKVVIKIIVKFIAMQVIGSLLPGIGNAIMAGASMAMFISDLVGFVGFIRDVGNSVNSLQDEMYAEAELDEEDGEEDEEEDIDGLNIKQLKDLIAKMEAEGKGGSEEYIEAKSRYLELLAEDYKQAGDLESMKMILNALETGKITYNPKEIGESPEGTQHIKELDLSKLQKAIEMHQANITKRKWQKKKNNIFDESEYKVLLTGEEDGGPMWAAIWRDIIVYVRDNIPVRFDSEMYQKICAEIVTPHIAPKLYKYHADAKWTYETEIQRLERVSNGKDEILGNTYNYREVSKEEFKEQDKFDVVIDKANQYKFDATSDSQKYRDQKSEENYLQKLKYFKWEDILKVLTEKGRRVFTEQDLRKIMNSNDTPWEQRAILKAALS
jgi:hypothetical protein